MHIFSVLLCPAFRKSHSDSFTVESRLSITFPTNTVWFQSAMYLKLKSLSVNLSLVTDYFIVSKIFNPIPGRNVLRWDLIKAAPPCSPYKDVLRSKKKKKKTFQIVKCAIIKIQQQPAVLNTEYFQCSVQSLSHVQLFATPWTAAHHASLSITNSRSLFKLMPIASVMPSNHLILCRPLLLPPSIFPSTFSQGLFQWVSSLHQVAKVLEFQP